MNVSGVTDVDVRMSARVREGMAGDGTRASLPGVKNVIAVGAGKGGVGKTTVAVNLAIALAKSGSKVGMIDGDIYGPNVPIMLGLKTQLTTDGQKIIPAEKYGLQVVSMGFMTGRRCADHLARADAARRAAAVLPRSAMGRSRLPRDRHAAGHGRRGAEPQPDRAGGRRDRRHDAAARVAGRQPPRGGDVQEAQHPDARHHREHELLRLPELPPRGRHLRPRRRRADGGGAEDSVPRTRFPFTSRFAKAATTACRCSSASPTRRRRARSSPRRNRRRRRSRSPATTGPPFRSPLSGERASPAAIA